MIYSLESLVWSPRKFQIEPNKSPIQTPNQNMITTRMNIQTTNPTASRHRLLHHLLLHQMVNSNMLRPRNKHLMLGRMKASKMNINPLGGFRKGLLTVRFGELMDENGRRSRFR